jgi:membrane associated rhomboid family serine protease
MGMKDRLAKVIAPVAIPNVTAYLLAFQGTCMMLAWVRPDFVETLLLDPVKVMQGEWWRVVTFLFMPPTLSPLWALFVMYFYWMMGTALEANWGTARYNLFLWIAVIMSVGGAFVPMALGLPAGVGTNAYLLGSVFLAFAFLYPDFVVHIFFILPVRIKWLALLTWLGYGVAFLIGDWMAKALVIAAVANFLLFFWRDIIDRMRFGRKQMSRQVKRIVKMSGPLEAAATMHKCVVCGATERSHPQVEFRYCAACGNKCYCMEHLQTHQHTGAGSAAGT